MNIIILTFLSLSLSPSCFVPECKGVNKKFVPIPKAKASQSKSTTEATAASTPRKVNEYYLDHDIRCLLSICSHLRDDCLLGFYWLYPYRP